METRSEARGGECKRDLSKGMDHSTDRHARKTRWPTIAVRRQDMPKWIAAIEARDVQSWMEKFHPRSNPSRPSRRPCCMIAHWNEEAYRRMRRSPQSIRELEM